MNSPTAYDIPSLRGEITWGVAWGLVIGILIIIIIIAIIMFIVLALVGINTKSSKTQDYAPY